MFNMAPPQRPNNLQAPMQAPQRPAGMAGPAPRPAGMAGPMGAPAGAPMGGPPQRPQGIAPPQRPQGMAPPQVDPQQQARIAALRGNRPQSMNAPTTRAQAQPRSYGADRGAERRAQWAQTQPTQAQHDDWKLRRTKPLEYHGIKDIQEGNVEHWEPNHNKNISKIDSPWQSEEGAILPDGKRVGAESLDDLGYVYKERNGPKGARSPGWIKKPPGYDAPKAPEPANQARRRFKGSR